MSTAHAKKFCACGHAMLMHDAPLDGGPCRICGDKCEGYTVPKPPLNSEFVALAAAQATSHLRLSIGALRDVEKGEDKTTGTSAAYWRQKLEAIADLLESDLKDLR